MDYDVQANNKILSASMSSTLIQDENWSQHFKTIPKMRDQVIYSLVNTKLADIDIEFSFQFNLLSEFSSKS